MEVSALLQACESMQPYALEVFRHLHKYPERGGQEVKTNQFIRSELEKWGISYEAPLPNLTIAVIHGEKEGAVVGLRCDTDALPVQEETGLPYASCHPGVMHACGHDGHVTIGLCTARLLKAHQKELHGTVKVIFQAAEEVGLGAKDAVASGLIDDVQVFFAIHLWSPYASGTLHVSPIVVSAAVDVFKIVITGKGGHGATPEKCCDALVAASELVTALQTIVSRRVAPTEPALLTVGTFHAGTASNIVAGRAELTGTIRTINEDTRLMMVESMTALAEHIAAAHGCTAVVENDHKHGEVRNEEKAAALARACAQQLLGDVPVQDEKTMMLGDDFCEYSAIAPACYVQVGIADEKKGTTAAHHNSHFQVDESVFPISTAWMTWFTLEAGKKWNA